MSGRMRRQQLLPGAIDTATAGQRMAREAFGSSDIDDRSTAPFDCLRWRMRARRWCFQSSEKCILMSVAVYVVLMVVVVGVVLLRYGSAFDQTTVELSCVDARDRFEAGEFRLQCASALLSLNECRKRAQQGLRVVTSEGGVIRGGCLTIVI